MFVSGEVDKVVVFCPDQEGNGRFVETPPLPIPFLDRVKGALAGEIEHEQDGNGIIADEWKHVDEFALSSEIPNGKSNLGVSDRDCLFHEIHPWMR